MWGEPWVLLLSQVKLLDQQEHSAVDDDHFQFATSTLVFPVSHLKLILIAYTASRFMFLGLQHALYPACLFWVEKADYLL